MNKKEREQLEHELRGIESLTKKDRVLLRKYGWEVDSEKPITLYNEDQGRGVSGAYARMVLEDLKTRKKNKSIVTDDEIEGAIMEKLAVWDGTHDDFFPEMAEEMAEEKIEDPGDDIIDKTRDRIIKIKSKMLKDGGIQLVECKQFNNMRIMIPESKCPKCSNLMTYRIEMDVPFDLESWLGAERHCPKCDHKWVPAPEQKKSKDRFVKDWKKFKAEYDGR